MQAKRVFVMLFGELLSIINNVSYSIVCIILYYFDNYNVWIDYIIFYRFIMSDTSSLNDTLIILYFKKRHDTRYVYYKKGRVNSKI